MTKPNDAAEHSGSTDCSQAERREWWIANPPWCWKWTMVSCFRGRNLDGDDIVHVKEVMPDDPDIDAIIAAATEVLRASHIGDQNFIKCLNGDDAARLRKALGLLEDVFRS